MKFRPRFSLKVLMLFMAAIGIFCAYHVSWIRQRHGLLAEISAQMKRVESLPEHVRFFFHRKTSAINFLWLFGESMHDSVVLVFEKAPTDEMPLMQNQRIITLHRQELEHAATLFPEADISFDIYLDDLNDLFC